MKRFAAAPSSPSSAEGAPDLIENHQAHPAIDDRCRLRNIGMKLAVESGLNLNPRPRWLSKRGLPRPLSGLLEAERLHLAEILHPVSGKIAGHLAFTFRLQPYQACESAVAI